MSIQNDLKEIITDEVLAEIEEYIDDIFEIIAAKKETPELKEELQNMQEMKKDFEEILSELEAGEIDDEEAQEIYDEIIDMLEGEDEN